MVPYILKKILYHVQNYFLIYFFSSYSISTAYLTSSNKSYVRLFLFLKIINKIIILYYYCIIEKSSSPKLHKILNESRTIYCFNKPYMCYSIRRYIIKRLVPVRLHKILTNLKFTYCFNKSPVYY